MRGFDHETILSPSFHGVHQERLAQWPAFCVPKNDQKIRGGGGTSRKIGRGCAARFLKPFQTKICDFPYPILDVIENLIPYFRPEALEPSAWQAVTERTRYLAKTLKGKWSYRQMMKK